MRLSSETRKTIIAIAIIVAGAAFVYFAPINQSWLGLKPGTSPTATPDYSGWRTYTNQKYGISLKYPPTFQLIPGKTGPLAEWQLYGVTNGIEIVSIEIPRSTQIRTNFLGASLRIGFSDDPVAIKECLNPPVGFGYENIYKKRMIGGETFKAFIRSEAGAGNFYEYMSYRALRNGLSPARAGGAQAGGCEVFEYSIHKTNIDNYPVEAGRKEFDRVGVINKLESILDTVQFLK